MAQYNRLLSGDTMRKSTMRCAMAMIEMIFAIVIIAISVISIPTMISVADKASKQITVDDDVVSRLNGWVIDKFQARWDQNYAASGSGPLFIAGDLACSRGSGTVWYRINPDSMVQCSTALSAPSAIPASGNGVLAQGIEQLNHGNAGNGETISITPVGAATYNVTATYEVRYVNSALDAAPIGNTASATWVLGSSTNMAPNGSLTVPTHLKRVVIRFQDNALGVDTTLTFFKSNKGNKMISNKNRNAFSLIELLFVIVILGIVGGIALETIRKYYENIYRTQEYTKRVSEADHILDQVTKYFENAISSSIVNLDRAATTACYGPPVNGDANDYTIAFVAADIDSLNGGIGTRPGWSEDTLLLAGNELNAMDVNFTAADTTITALGSTLRNSAVYDSDSADVSACARFNWDDAGGFAGFHKLDVAVNPISSTNIRLNLENNATNGKRKYLLRTGYAFRVQDNGDFIMYSNFRPWLGERYTAAAQINVLAENVAHIYADYDATDFQANPDLSDRGLVWRVKVCMRGLDANLSNSDAEGQTICRERRVHVRY